MKKNGLFKNLIITWKYMTGAKLYLFLYFLVAVVDCAVGVVIPLFSAKVILNMTSAAIHQLILAAITVFVIEFLGTITEILKEKLYSKIYYKVLMNIEKKLAYEILEIEIDEINKATTGMFIDRMNNDVNELAEIFIDYVYYITNILSKVGVLVSIFILNKYLFVYSVITSICIFIISKIRINKRYESRKKLKVNEDKATSLVSELMRGIKDIKSLNANETMLNQVVNKAEINIKERVNILKINAIYGFARRNLSSMFDLGFILLGCHLYTLSLLTIPTFVIVYNYQGKIQNLLTGLATILETNKKFIINANRIYEITDGDRFKKEEFGIKNIKQLNGNIEFKDVTFGYDEDKDVLINMNFKINENEKVAFVGRSGVGKTTIFNLINKLYECESGEILLDNNNINELSRNSIRNNISVITQNPYIFNFSIKDNLMIANEKASMKDIKEACKLACIDEYIMNLPDKYDTILGENGVILSGGQKQRIAIARALIKKSSIILFDEATSALDNETQREIQIAIDNLKGKHTILIVAHRLSTVIDADKIFVIDKGKVVNVGKHKQLLRESKVYRTLYEKELDDVDQNEPQ